MCASLLLLILIPSTSALATDLLCFVEDSATGAENGTSWTGAYTDLQSAMGEASCSEIWVAAGRYTPTTSSDQSVSFKPKQWVALYGGFSGTETERKQRVWQANITVLSGDIDGNDITDVNGVITNTNNIVGNNTYQVLIGCGIDEASILDGYTITGGSASGDTHDMRGGGMYTHYGCRGPNDPVFKPTLTNRIFSGNTGGAMYTYGKPIISNATFIHNESSVVIIDQGNPVLNQVIFRGGGVSILDGSATMTNVVFIDAGVSAAWDGFTLINGIISGNRGGIGLSHSNALLTNVSMWGNSGPGHERAISLNTASLELNNSIVWGMHIWQVSDLGDIQINYSLVEDGCPATGSDTICDHLVVDNPLFEDAANDNLHLQSGSPAIDAGNNDLVPPGTLYDLAGNPRFIDITEIPDTGHGVPPIVDMGAYEYQVPIAVDDSYMMDEDIQLMVSTPGVIGNDIELNGNALTAVLDDGPAHGLLTLNLDGSFVYTPTLNYNGTDSFTYNAYDGELDSNIATVNLSITPVNDAPAAVNNSYLAKEGTTLIVNAPGLLGNDTDVENNPLIAILNVGPTHGELALNTNGSFVYTPDTDYLGTDSFTYLANDSGLNSRITKVSITIWKQNDIFYLPIINR